MRYSSDTVCAEAPFSPSFLDGCDDCPYDGVDDLANVLLDLEDTLLLALERCLMGVVGALLG